MGQLALTLLGPVKVVWNGEPVTSFRTHKAQALLLYLAADRQSTHRREQLMTLLWPGMPESSARANLRQVLFLLRQTIPDLDDRSMEVPILIADRHAIQVNPDANITIDTEQFEAKLARVQDHKHVELLACDACYQTLQAAVSLYRGDFLANFYVDDSNEFQEWAEVTRQQYRRKMLDALDTLATMAMRRSAFSEAQAYAERQLDIDDLRESAYRQLMKILARRGQRAAALSIYDACRRLLAEELSMAPAAQTTSLYEKIQTGDLHFDLPQTPDVRGYELKEVIGEGTYGVIHRALQPAVAREVAVKVIQRRYANDAAFIRRFEAEAQTIALLEHPHIVPLYDYWRDPDGAYLVMRYMRGGNLRSILAGGPLAPERALVLLEQIAGALAVAHQRGVVHRDIKPANILLDEEGNAYLSDFGIAWDLTGQMRHTAKGAFVGTPDYVSPEIILDEPVNPPSDIYSLGILLYEILTGQKPFAGSRGANLIHRHLHDPLPLLGERHPTLPPQVDAIIQRATAKRPADRYTEAVELAEAFDLALQGKVQSEPIASIAPAEIMNPYKGLRPFQEVDAADFFGREALVERLLTCLAASPFVAVVGPSGSGKSSTVKAGLIPALRQGALPGSERWFVVEMVPGRYPLEELEKALWPIAVNPPPSLVEPIARDSRGLLRTVRRVLPDEDRATLLLFIDQFEELFTLVDDRRRRDHFVDSILTALADAASPLRVVITLRADFYDRPLQKEALGRWLRENTEVVLPLSLEELTVAISQPASGVGVAPEEGLVAAMAADLRDEPGALPLLQYALTELFEQREDGRMTLAAYRKIGGASGALARRAEDLYKDLDAAGQEAARQLFLRLVTLGEGSEDTRRRVLRTELEGIVASLPDSKAPETTHHPESIVDQVLDRFGRYRLLTFDRDPLTRGPTVEVAHEALLREWPRLQGWLEEGRDDIRLQRLLANAGAEWRASQKEAGYLLRGARLRHFESWVADSDVALTDEERAYLQASLAARDRREAEAAARQAREEALEARSRNRLRYLVGVLAVAAVLAAILSILAINFARQAQEEARTATSRELAAAAISNLEVDPERSALLALAGLDAAYTVEAENALHRALPEMHLLQTLTEHALVESVAISPDGARFAAVDEGGNVIILDATTGEGLLQFYAGSGILYGILFSPDGKRLITASEDHTARVWDSSSGEELLRIDHGAPLGDVAISADGKRLATAGADAVARVWDAGNGRQILALRGHAQAERVGSLHPGGVVNVAFIADGQRIATGGADGTVRLWDAGDGRMLQVLPGHTNEAYIAPGPRGNHLLTAGYDGQVRVWDISPGKETPQLMLATNQVQPARDAAFSPGGKLVAVAGQDGAVRVWDVISGQRSLTLVGHAGQVDDVAFSPDGSRLVTVAADGTLKVWDLAPGRERLTIADGPALDVAYSPDGRRLATSHPDGSIAIRDSASGQILLMLPGHPEFKGGALYLTFSPDSQILASASWDTTAKLWDLSSGEALFTLSGHTGYVWQAAFSPTGRRVATASGDGSAKMWDTSTGKALMTFSRAINRNGVRNGVVDIAFSPDGSLVATSSCEARIWNAASGQQLMALDGGNCLWGVAFSPDGQRLATGSVDGSVIVWDISGTEGKVIYTFTGHTALITRLAFSPEGQRLATASFDGTAKVWDLTTGQVWLTLPMELSVTKVTFSPDGTELATAGWDGLVRIWLLELDDLVTLTRSRLTRDLTQEECQEFLHVPSCP